MICFSDLQMHPFRAFATYRGGDNSRRMEIAKRLEKVVELGNAPDNDCVVFAGDFFEERGKVDVVSVGIAKEILSKLKKPFVACSGNHDLTRVGYSSMEAFRELADDLSARNKIFRLDELTVIHDKQLSSWVLLPVPAVEDDKATETVKRALELAKITHGNAHYVLISHGNVKGEEFKLPIWIRAGFEPHFLMTNFVYSIIGHYHMPFLKGNILMPGAAIPHHFGDDCGGGSLWRVELLSMQVNGKKVIHHDTERIFFSHPAFVTVEEGFATYPYNCEDYYRILSADPEFQPPAGTRFVLTQRKNAAVRPASTMLVQDDKTDLVVKFAERSAPQDKIRMKLTGLVLLEAIGKGQLDSVDEEKLEKAWEDE